MIVVLLILGVVGLTALGLLFAKVKELYNHGCSWGYSFLQVLGGLK